MTNIVIRNKVKQTLKLLLDLKKNKLYNKFYNYIIYCAIKVLRTNIR